MRILKLTFLIFTLTSFKVFGQPDSITAINCFKHIIRDGKITNERYVVNQKTYDDNGFLIKEITYNDSTHQVNKIAYFFYRNDLPISKEEYNATNSLLKITRWQYNTSKYLIEEIIFEPDENQMKINQKVKFIYEESHLIKKVVSGPGNRTIEKSTWVYQPSKVEVSTVFSKNDKNKNITRVDTTIFFNEGLVIAKKIVAIDRKDIISDSLIEFQYLPESSLVEKVYLKNNLGDTVVTIVNSYNKEKKIFKKIYLDANKNKNACYSIVYNRYFIDPGRKEMVVLPK
jgi:hypothetical protein